MERLGIYPFSAECLPILQHIGLLSQRYRLTALLSPVGWGWVGQSFAADTYGNPIVVQPPGEVALADVDVLLVTAFPHTEKFEEECVYNLCSWAPRLSALLCSEPLFKDDWQRLNEACRASGCALRAPNFTATGLDYGVSLSQGDREPLWSLPVPILAVAGLWEGTDKFEVSLSLREKFLQAGYKVTQIGSRGYCELLGFHSFPQFMFYAGIDEAEKILLFNHYLANLIRQEDPDIAIVTVPGAVQGYNERIPHRSGILAYEVLQAMTVDYLTLCVFYHTEVGAFAQQLSDACRYKFGCPVDCFHMATCFVNDTDTNEYGEIRLNLASHEMVTETLTRQEDTAPIPAVHIWNEKDRQRLFNSIVENLGIDYSCREV